MITMTIVPNSRMIETQIRQNYLLIQTENLIQWLGICVLFVENF